MKTEIVITYDLIMNSARVADFATIFDLLKKGAEVNQSDDLGMTALMGAAANGHIDIVNALISAGADVNKADNNGVIINSPRDNDFFSTIFDLLKKGDEVTQSDNSGRTALMGAATNGHIDITKALIFAGADVNKADIHGATALMGAAANGHIAIVDVLISAGAEVNQTDCGHRTALMLASREGYRDIVQCLISARADFKIYTYGTYGGSALMLASREGYSDIVKSLISAGADVNKTDIDGWTALMLAAANGHIDIVKALISAGADISKTDKVGMTALMWATQTGHERIKKTILLKQALNTQNVQYIIRYIKILFRIFPSGLGILYSSLKELSYALNEIEPIEYCDALKKALRHFLRQPQPSGCDQSELDQLITSIRKYDSDVNKSYERAAMTLGLFQRRPKCGDEKLLEVPELQKKIVNLLPSDNVCMLGKAQTCRGHTGG